MNVFYNPNGIGDVLIIPLIDGNRDDLKHESIGPITKITNNNEEVLGYNIFNASSHLQLTNTGKFALTEELLQEIKQLFQSQGLHDNLDFDLSPKIVVGYVLEKTQHENADKLSVCKVDVGDETLQIVCGAPNVDQGQKVVVAKVGSTMPNGLKIKPTELRGVPSNGMICSQKELGIPDAPKEKGIYVLDDSYSVGQPF
ncbi:YtpR family tRNA-binding protein [Ornithinibacillus salinisoli]|uniref:YtpR family tRNA-binding protein n=1 Tax=Ornithinibacillus salinisoli TaxID=1848459 RepID=A0ABW4W6C8_9BACI